MAPVSDRMTPQLREATRRALNNLPDEEAVALLVALEWALARPGATVGEMLMGMLRQLGHTEEQAAVVLADAADNPLDLREKLN